MKDRKQPDRSGARRIQRRPGPSKRAAGPWSDAGDFDTVAKSEVKSFDDQRTPIAIVEHGKGTSQSACRLPASSVAVAGGVHCRLNRSLVSIRTLRSFAVARCDFVDRLRAMEIRIVRRRFARKVHHVAACSRSASNTRMSPLARNLHGLRFHLRWAGRAGHLRSVRAGFSRWRR